MSLKIPQELFIKLEEEKLFNKIKTEFAFDNMDHKKGVHLVLYYDDRQILNLASDTLEFWTTKNPPSVNYICLLERKKVVWRYYQDYARKVVHLFEGDLHKIENAEVKMNSTLRKNVSMVEIFCDYDSYKTVETKIENINRGVEHLNCITIKVKPKEKIKARKFVETSLDNDKSVLCIYHEKEEQLDIFGKTQQNVEKAVNEFSQGPLKMTGGGTSQESLTLKGGATKGATPNATNTVTTVFQMTTGSFTQSDVSTAEPKEKHLSSFVETNSKLSKASSIPKISIDRTGADSKDQRLATSIGNTVMAEAQLPDSTNDSAKSSKSPNKPNMSIGGTGADSKDQRFARSIGNKEMAGAKSSISPNKPNMSVGGSGADSKDQRFAKKIGNKEMAEAKSSKSPNKPNMSIGGTGADSKDQRFARSIGNKEMAEAKSSISPNKPNMSIGGTGADSKDQRFTRSIGNKELAEAKPSISPNKPNMSIGGTGADSKDQRFARSIGKKEMTEAQLPDSNSSSAKPSNHPSKDESMTDMAISSKASTKHYSQVLQIKSGSTFLYQFTLGGLKVSVYQHSIVDVKGVDAIVNAANDIMVHGGGVAYYISKAAGKQMDDEGKAYVSKYGKLRVGNNCVTGAGRLSYKGIIHAVGPQWADYIGSEDRCAEDLYSTIMNTLRAAKNKTFQRIALCAISAG